MFESDSSDAVTSPEIHLRAVLPESAQKVPYIEFTLNRTGDEILTPITQP
jgi:hypothetical protein